MYVFLPRLRGRWIGVSRQDGGGEFVRNKETRSRKFANELRQELTDAEIILWSVLKNKGLMNYRFRRQHPIGPFIVDFANVKYKLVIEVDGDTHSSDEEIAYDNRRTRYLEAQGWRILRCWNDEVYRNLDGVCDSILLALKSE